MSYGRLLVGNIGRAAADVFGVDGTFIKTLARAQGLPLLNQITDFTVDDKHTVKIECDPTYTDCLVAAYDHEGALLETMPQPTGPFTFSDITIGNNVLYVSDCLHRSVNKFDVVTLEDLGPLSVEINTIGIAQNKEYSKYILLSNSCLGFILLCAIPAVLIYIRYKRAIKIESNREYGVSRTN